MTDLSWIDKITTEKILIYDINTIKRRERLSEIVKILSDKYSIYIFVLGEGCDVSFWKNLGCKNVYCALPSWKQINEKTTNMLYVIDGLNKSPSAKINRLLKLDSPIIVGTNEKSVRGDHRYNWVWTHNKQWSCKNNMCDFEVIDVPQENPWRIWKFFGF